MVSVVMVCIQSGNRFSYYISCWYCGVHSQSSSPSRGHAAKCCSACVNICMTESLIEWAPPHEGWARRKCFDEVARLGKRPRFFFFWQTIDRTRIVLFLMWLMTVSPLWAERTDWRLLFCSGCGNFRWCGRGRGQLFQQQPNVCLLSVYISPKTNSGLQELVLTPGNELMRVSKSMGIWMFLGV